MVLKKEDQTDEYKKYYVKLEYHYKKAYTLAKKAKASDRALNAIKGKWLATVEFLSDYKYLKNI